MQIIEHPFRLSQNASQLDRSVMRDLLKHAVDPGIISLAGGLPSSEHLPVQQLQDCMNAVLIRDSATALQYSPQYPPLRQWIADYMQGRGVACNAEDIFITNGNQQALNILARLLLNSGDVAVIEEAVFTGIQQATAGMGANVVTIPTNLQDGADMDALEDALQHHDVRMIVLIPDFHNPLGISMSAPKRQRAAELAAQYRVPLIEDDAYSQLSFSADSPAPIAAYNHAGYVFYMGSFSKMLAPGLRLGFMVIPPALRDKITVIRESIDLETSTLIQRTVAEFLQRGLLAPHLEQLTAAHQLRADALMSALDTHLSDIATWTKPQGGLFTWVTLPDSLNTGGIVQDAIAAGVVFVPGGAFAINGGYENTMRLNFSKVQPDQFEAGIQRLSIVIRQNL